MRLIVVFGVLLLCVSCTSLELERRRAITIKNGMIKSQVIEIMGDPLASELWATEERLFWTDTVVILEKGRVIGVFSEDRSTRYQVEVDAFLADFPVKKVALILPSVPGMDVNSIEFLPVKKMVSSLLGFKGYSVTEDGQAADTVVFVNFGISEPKTETRTWSEPVYEYVTRQPQQTNTTYTYRDAYGVQREGKIKSETTYGTSGGIRYRGERLKSSTTTSYTRHLILEAVDYDYYLKTKEMRAFWKIIALSEGRSNDLRGVLPYIGVAVLHAIEDDTRGRRSVVIYDTDLRARFLQRERFPASR